MACATGNLTFTEDAAMRTPINDHAELRLLDQQLAIGLNRYLKQSPERTGAVFKSKQPAAYTYESATADLDAILVRAAEAFIPADRIVDLMESRIAGIRARQAVAFSHAPRFVSGNL
jgi:hypothetical protein